MALGHQKRAVGTFSSYQDAEVAVRELRDSGFPMDRVSVVGRDTDRANELSDIGGSGSVGDKGKQVAHDTQADQGAKKGAVAGGTLGGLTGLLVGLGALAIPGIGPVMLGGALATALATTISGGAIGAAAGGLVGALVGLGIPEDRAKVYNDRVSRGDYLVIVDGSQEEVHRAEGILSHRGIQEWGIYDAAGHDNADRATYPAGTLYPPGTPYPGETTGTRRDPLV
ncbi:MAG: general stress protein [Leptolyngbya sp. BL-A-14]